MVTALRPSAQGGARRPTTADRRHTLSHRLKDQLGSLLFLVPTLILFAIFIIYPIFYNFQASTLKWNGVDAGTFVGLQNFVTLVHDPVFWITIRNSALWIPLTLVPQALIGFLLAVTLNMRVRGRTIYRAVFFLPAVLSPVVVGMVWQQILDPSSGVLESLGAATHIGWLSANFLGNPNTAIFTLMGVNVWMFMGFSMLFYLAGLQLIDPSLLEAARVDGANAFQRTLRITLPLLRNTHLTLLLLGVIGSLKTFELVYVMTQGGPNNASQMLPTYAFQEAFQDSSVGYASTISVLLLLIAVGSALAMTRVFGAGFLSGEDK